MKMSGTLINYFQHCKRQCWMKANRLDMEDNSEDVRIGKILHNLKFENYKNPSVKIDGVEIDSITSKYIIEYKKSDADITSAKYQILYDLYILKNKGIIKQGKLQFEELKYQKNTEIKILLTSEEENNLLNIIQQIESLCSNSIPPPVINDKKCKKCAYYEYCYI